MLFYGGNDVIMPRNDIKIQADLADNQFIFIKIYLVITFDDV